MTTCLGCGDRGYVMFDGVPRECANGCAAAQAWRDAGRRAPRTELNSRDLPPGGDVLLRRDAAAAAGLPPGILGSDRLVRATIEAEPHVHALVHCTAALIRSDLGAVERARELLRSLPAWAIPTDLIPIPDEDPQDQTSLSQPRRSVAAPLEPPV